MIVHLCAHKDWLAAQAQGEYRAASLQTAGFIHLSRLEQILRVANAWYRGQTGLVLLWVAPEKLKAELRYEPSDYEADAGETFPHLYGPLNLEAVQKVSAFAPDEDGIFRTLPA